jgi:putative glutamine amidotransferase
MSTLLVSCRDKKSAVHNYVPALKAAGWRGAIHLMAPGDPAPSLDGVAALLLTGGNDIDPKHWDPKEPAHPKAEIDGDRDAQEIPLIRAAWDKGLPIFGICRGEQILNVALGGSMIQDVPDATGCDPHLHQHGTPDVPELRHTVNVTHGSKLADLLGGHSVAVNSRHHQAVDRVAPGLRAVAFHPQTLHKGHALIEGIEAEDPHRWVIGVQWHPENLAELRDAAGDASRGLFSGFVQAAEAYAEQKVALSEKA